MNESDAPDQRTPDELEALYRFHDEASRKYQIQVWHAGELAGTYWTEHKAQHKAESFWEGYKEFRLQTFSDLCANLEVKSLTDERWMTSNTFLRYVKVGADEEMAIIGMSQ